MSFSEAGHLNAVQVEEHRRDGGRVVCGSCHRRNITAKDVAEEAKRLKRLLTCATCKKEFARQQHISDRQESDHFTRKSKVVCAGCVAYGFTSRSWQAFQCSGKCEKKLPKSAFSVDASHVARDEKKGTLKCKACK